MIGRVAGLTPGGVFWRTFLLIAVLMVLSISAWYQSFRVLEREPRALQAAELVVSIVNLTRAALVNSDPDKRRSLLIDLAQNEDIRIYPLEPSDLQLPLPADSNLAVMARAVRRKLGDQTLLSARVNGEPGLWVSFYIEDDGYWVVFDRDRLENAPRLQWFTWGALALVMSLVGAAVISRLINLPLKRLTGAAVAIGRGERPPQLPVEGPREISEANQSFNAMVHELDRIEADRGLLLAGISHDLRTPLTRLRLEVELNPLDEATRLAMNADIDQMDLIIGQFLDYARPANERASREPLDLAALVSAVTSERAASDEVHIETRLEPTAPVPGNPTEIKRVVLNLIENARRYGKTPGAHYAEVSVRVGGGARPFLEVADRGTGVPDDQLERLKRPFTRLDAARSQAEGAGLGLAIIDRIAKRHHARFELENRPDGGFVARLRFGEPKPQKSPLLP